jgi:ankyrin repeat protein
MNLKTGTLLLLLFTTPSVFNAQTKQELNDKMFEAVRAGDAAAVTALLDKGADVNAKFRYGMTALFKAAERGNLEAAKVLLARGVDVSVKDSFYGATALSWALQNDHNDVAQAILIKDPASVDEVLLTGARGGSVELVDIALKQGGAKPETLTMALAATMGEKDKVAIADMLKKAGAVSPPVIDAAILQTYVGNYKNERGNILTLSVKDGSLWALATGQQQPISLVAVDKVSFKPTQFDGMLMTMTLEGDKVVGFNLKQGPNNSVYKKE